MPGGMGEDSDGGSDDEGLDEDDDPLSKRFEPTTVRRKKYRADDEVEALCELIPMHCSVCFDILFLLCHNN